jgi:TetR/AcrR family transcriptional regulator, cholesterol catabolism regulator
MSETSAAAIGVPAGRRQMTGRQAAALDLLLDAAAVVARQHGHAGVTVRGVASRAGVATASAYHLVASKDHLLAEMMWREMARLPAAAVPEPADAQSRVLAELRVLGTFTAGDPLLAAAGTTALLGDGPDVADVRLRMGRLVSDRLARALGEPVDVPVLRSLNLLYTGTLLAVGLGHLRSAEAPDVLTEAAGLILRGRQ